MLQFGIMIRHVRRRGDVRTGASRSFRGRVRSPLPADVPAGTMSPAYWSSQCCQCCYLGHRRRCKSWRRGHSARDILGGFGLSVSQLGSAIYSARLSEAASGRFARQQRSPNFRLGSRRPSKSITAKAPFRRCRRFSKYSGNKAIRLPKADRPARSGFEYETRSDGGIRRNRRQIREQFRIVLHYLQDRLRFDVLVDIKCRLENA